MARTSRVVLGAVSYGVSIGLVAVVVSRVDAERVSELFSHARLHWLLAALCFAAAAPFAATMRWRGVLAAQKDTRLPFGLALRATMIANVLNCVLPSKMGDLAKALHLRRRGGITLGVGTVFLERLVDLTLLGLLGLVGYRVAGAPWGLWAGGGLVVVAPMTLVAIASLPLDRLRLPARIHGPVSSARAVFRAWLRAPRAIAMTLAGAATVWALVGLMAYSLSQAIAVDADWGFVLAAFPLAILAGLVPVTISGIGVRDSVLVALLGARMAPEEATLIAVGYTLLAYWFVGLIGVPFVLREAIALLRKRK